MAKILVVDDEKKILQIAVKVLATDGHEILTAENANKAITILENEGPFQVIISDDRMPEMRGTEFLERAREFSPDTIRILTTGYYDKQLMEIAVNRSGIFRFLQKPLDMKNVKKVVSEAVMEYEVNTANQKTMQKAGVLEESQKKLVEEHEKVTGQMGKWKKLAQILGAALVAVILIGFGVQFALNYINEQAYKPLGIVRGDWIVYPNQTAKNKKTNLMWMTVDFRQIEQRRPNEWAEAMAWAKKMNKQKFGGYNDWRIPTIDEYARIYDPRRTRLAYDKNDNYRVGYPEVFEEGGGYAYWSLNEEGLDKAKYFFFIGGYDRVEKKDFNNHYMSVRLVRDAR